MNKETFVKKLRSKLQVLESTEVEEIISEYTAHIDQKIRDGKSEEQAIADFGNIDELAKEILSAYHINPQDKTLEDYFNAVVNFINKTTEKVMKYDSKTLANFVVEFLLTCLVLVLIKWVLGIFVAIVGGVFSWAAFGILRPFRVLLSFIFELSYFFFTIYVLYVFLQKKLFNEPPATTKRLTLEEKPLKAEPIKVEKTKASNYYEPVAKKTIKVEPAKPPEETELTLASETIIAELDSIAPAATVKSPNNSASEVLLTLVRFAVGLVLWFPAFLILLACLVGFGIVISLVVVNLKYIWLLVLLCGGVFIALAFVLPLSKLVWGKALR